MKKRISIMLLLAMGSSLLPAAGNPIYATDLTAQQKFDALKARGIFSGITDGSAALDQNMNRAQFARVSALLLNLEGIGTPDTKVVTEKPFSDVELDAWYVEEVAAAKEAGIMVGSSDGTFNPDNDMSVQELAVATARILGLEPEEGAEVEGAADWAAGYIQALKSNDIDLPTNYTDGATRSVLVSVSFQTEAAIAKWEAEQKAEEELRLAEEARLLKEEQEKLKTGLIGVQLPQITIPSIPVILPPSVVPIATANMPTIFPAGGTVQAGTLVTLSHSNGATIYYTTDGSTPTLENSLRYSAPIQVNNTMTIKAFAAQYNYNNSNVMTASYTIIVQKTALELINEAAAAGDWTGIDAATFTDAGITGVTADNLAAITSAMDAGSTGPWTVSAIQDIVNTVLNDNIQQQALTAINTAAVSVNWTGIDASTFALAGINGVTADNLFSIQYYLEIDAAPFPRSALEIQGIVDRTLQELAVQLAVESIYNHLRSFGFEDPPTVAVFESAGITGVDAANLDTILAELSLAYQESRGPFGTPMSTKQDIQDVIDRYLQ